MSAKEIIYSRQYPDPQEEIAAALRQADRQDTDAFPAAKPDFAKFLNDIMHNSTYRPLPGRGEQSRYFIGLAQELSETYAINTDIIRTDTAIEAHLHMPYCYCPHDMTRMLARLINTCDTITTFADKTADGCLLILSFDTHEQYINGKPAIPPVMRL